MPQLPALEQHESHSWRSGGIGVLPLSDYGYASLAAFSITVLLSAMLVRMALAYTTHKKILALPGERIGADAQK